MRAARLLPRPLRSSSRRPLRRRRDVESAVRYFDLKLAELRLVHEHREKGQQEKDEQKRIKEQMREEQKAQEEIDRAKADAEKEEARSAAALDRARAEVAASDAARPSRQPRSRPRESKYGEPSQGSRRVEPSKGRCGCEGWGASLPTPVHEDGDDRPRVGDVAEDAPSRQPTAKDGQLRADFP